MTETIENHCGIPESMLSAWLDGDDDELLASLEHIGAMVEGFKETLGRLEFEVYRRMEKHGATAIPSETYICEINTKTDYNQFAFTPLKEIFNEADLKDCLIEAHTKEVEVLDKWATVTVKRLATRYGAEALRIVENARTETRGRLKFARRNK
jgi:hypothetical protein